MKPTASTLLALAIASVGLPAVAQETGPSAEQMKDTFPAAPYSPYAGANVPTRVFWGDTHLHTGLSMDAGLFGARLGLSLRALSRRAELGSPLALLDQPFASCNAAFLRLCGFRPRSFGHAISIALGQSLRSRSKVPKDYDISQRHRANQQVVLGRVGEPGSPDEPHAHRENHQHRPERIEHLSRASHQGAHALAMTVGALRQLRGP